MLESPGRSPLQELENKKEETIIPTGKQLPRTPPQVTPGHASIADPDCLDADLFPTFYIDVNPDS